jgi:threonine synthase
MNPGPSLPLRYEDSGSGETLPVDVPRWRGASGRHLNLTRHPGLRRADIDTGERSLWRYRKAIGVDAAARVSMGEGWTPLTCGVWDDHPVAWKLDFVMPTGSFKDRGMTVMISHLRQCGLDHVLEDSSGNAGASLAAYAAAAGMRCRILVPETASYPKIVQIAATGADAVVVPGTRQDVADAALAMAAEIYYASHNWNAFFAEGVKTVAYELWEQLGFRAPDNVIVPLGYGANVLGAERGFEELRRNGEIDRMPRIFGVQAVNCAAYHAAWVKGVDALVPIDVRPTVAEGIASSKPTRVREVLAAIRGTGGEVLAVTEDEIARALRSFVRQGLYIEPTSATAGAGLSQLLARGVIGRDETTAVVLTGTGLKAGERIGELLGVRARRLG